jgi:hypothetical protein
LTLVLDSGAFIAIEKNDRAMWRRLKVQLLAKRVPVSHGGVVGQAWRGGRGRQALLAKVLAGIDVRAVDEPLGRAAGELLARVRGTDVIDVALVLLADNGDDIATSDADDLEPLATALGRHVELIHV